MYHCISWQTTTTQLASSFPPAHFPTNYLITARVIAASTVVLGAAQQVLALARVIVASPKPSAVAAACIVLASARARLIARQALRVRRWTITDILTAGIAASAKMVGTTRSTAECERRRRLPNANADEDCGAAEAPKLNADVPGVSPFRLELERDL